MPKQFLAGCAVAFMLAVTAVAGPYEDGSAAYMRGDFAEAARWYRLDADRGYAYAQFNLGSLYQDGRGVPQDFVLSYMWFNLAAAQGIPYADKYRDIAASKMTREQIAEAQRLARDWKASPK